MAVHDFDAQRLYCEADLAAGATISCSPQQMNYLVNVLRLRVGDAILVFNGRQGEWQAELARVSKRACELAIIAQVRVQEGGPDVTYVFAPLKRGRLDYIVQKATEMGVAGVQPVMTRRTVAGRVNVERMRANVIEAAEQCGILRLPKVSEPVRLDELIDGWAGERRLIFADEGAEIASPLAVLGALEPGPAAVLIGPEGGFDDTERQLLLRQPFTVRLSLGPRVMRADTAGVAVLALLNAVLGDWR